LPPAPSETYTAFFPSVCLSFEIGTWSIYKILWICLWLFLSILLWVCIATKRKINVSCN
jgi:hypothetical protein